MKITNYFSMLIALAVITTSFPSCGDEKDDPSPDPNEQHEGDKDKNDNEDDSRDILKSPYKPCFTENKIKELVIEEIERDHDRPFRTESYFYHNLFSYDDSGRICEQKVIAKHPNGVVLENLIRKIYIGDTIKTIFPNGGGFNNFLLLNPEGYICESDGYITSRKYDKEGYLIGYYMTGYGDNGHCTLKYENGNLIRESAPLGTYEFSYTEYFNNTSLDLSYFLVRREGTTTLTVPTDIEGKRSKNLPAKRTYVRGTIWTTYSYEFDSKNRAIKITSVHESNFSQFPDTIIYHITYMD